MQPHILYVSRPQHTWCMHDTHNTHTYTYLHDTRKHSHIYTYKHPHIHINVRVHTHMHSMQTAKWSRPHDFLRTHLSICWANYILCTNVSVSNCSVSISVSVSVFVYTYIHTHFDIRVCVCTYMQTHSDICVRAYMCMHAYAYLSIHSWILKCALPGFHSKNHQFSKGSFSKETWPFTEPTFFGPPSCILSPPVPSYAR